MKQRSDGISSHLRWASALSSLPEQPGVYWFLNAGGEVLYVGKAKNLKKRVLSYTGSQVFGKTQVLVREANKLRHSILHSELEALLIEAELIRS